MSTETKRSGKLRLVLVLVLFVALYALSSVLGLTDWEPEDVRARVQGAGVWGFLLYAAVFAGGEFLHIPGMVFVAAGILAYGKVLGFAAAFLASVISVCFSFVVVRTIGGRALGQIDRPFVQRTLERLDERPIRVVLVLRLVLWLAPALNYALAMTNLRFRDYLIGSALGLVIPVGGATLFFDWMFASLGG
jgi:uncharacterized membrane protein YdjX (TVP38/TMEM64 family)